MPSVKEYVMRKERAIMRIQRGIQEKTVEMDRGTEKVARSIAQYGAQYQRDLERFTKEWYG